MRWGFCLALAGALLSASVILPGRRLPDAAATLAPPLGQTQLTEAEALDSARGGMPVPAAAQRMDYQSAAAFLGEGEDPRLAPTTQVWVVTVYQPQQYTVILDATDGAVIDSCIGCRSL